MRTSSAILTQSKSFSLRIIKLYSFLCKQKKEFVLSKQILRSGTSIGANAKGELLLSLISFPLQNKYCNYANY